MTTTGYDPRAELLAPREPVLPTGTPAPYGFPFPEPRVDVGHSLRGDAQFGVELDAAADEELDGRQIGYMARTLHIDNPTGNWYYVPAVFMWIEPYTMAHMIRLLPTQIATIQRRDPSPTFTSDPQEGERLSATWYDEELPSMPGRKIVALEDGSASWLITAP